MTSESLRETAGTTVPAETSEPAAWTIEPWSDGVRPRMREVWQYRKLTSFFAFKAVQKMYKRTYLGWAWLFIRPLFPLATQALIFGNMLQVGSDGVPYFLFLVTASTVWQLFSAAVTWGTRSLELNRGLLKQLYIPRLILPLAMMSPAFLTFVIYLAVLAGAMIWYRVTGGQWFVSGGFQFLWAILATFMAVLFAFAISLWTSVPALHARDVRFTLGYVLGFWVFLSAVYYPLSTVPERWRPWLLLNPMVPIVEAFKFGVLGIGTVEPWHVGIAGALVLVVLAGGLAFFARAEAGAADAV